MSTKLKDATTVFHDCGIYLPRRSIEIFDEVIDRDTFKRVFKNLHALDNTPGDINIFIDSPGGDFTQGMAIYDAIKGCKNRVKGMVYGEACSAASIVLQACDERLIVPNASVMIHLGTEGVEGHPVNNKRWIKKMDQDSILMENIYLEKIREKNPGFTKKQLKRLLLFDTILNAQKCVELGLIDKIAESIE